MVSSLTLYTSAEEHKWRMKNETQIRNIMTAWQASPARHGEVYSLRYLPHTPSKSVNGEIVIKSVKKTNVKYWRKTWPHQFIHLDLNHPYPSYFYNHILKSLHNGKERAVAGHILVKLTVFCLMPSLCVVIPDKIGSGILLWF